MANIAVGPVAGIDCLAYYNSGTHASPTWVAIPNMRDVSIPDYGVNPVEANSRASNYEAFVAGLIKVGITFNYLHVRGTDTVRDIFTTMISGRSTKEVAIMDGGIALTGARGIRMFAICDKFAYSQDLEGAQVWEGSLKPAYVIESSAKVDPDLFLIT